MQKASSNLNGSSPRFPRNPLLAFYGDDFTGSADVLESLACAGLKTALFLQAPGAAELKKFPHLHAFGVAGSSRQMTPREMDRELPKVFEALKASGASVVHYKICSTFDSSARVGSIGRAIDIGLKVFERPFVPLLAGAPSLGRYCVFGNLFARSGLGSEPYRLDRHPTMSAHPITPMAESDLRVHLGKQTRKQIGLFDILALEKEEHTETLNRILSGGAEVVLFDVLRDSHLPAIGELLLARGEPGKATFIVGSSGVEYTLTAWWRQCGALAFSLPDSRTGPASGLVVASGSCSPVTERQINAAVAAGFAEVPVDTVALVSAAKRPGAISRALAQAEAALAAGANVIFHTARGPRDPRLSATKKALRSKGRKSAEILGTALGELLLEALRRSGLRRAAVTGGDTSGYVARALGVEALEYLAPVTPGCPLCRIHASSPVTDGCEIVFKGGQNGWDDFFLTVLSGKRPATRLPGTMKPTRIRA